MPLSLSNLTSQDLFGTNLARSWETLAKSTLRSLWRAKQFSLVEKAFLLSSIIVSFSAQSEISKQEICLPMVISSKSKYFRVGEKNLHISVGSSFILSLKKTKRAKRAESIERRMSKQMTSQTSFQIILSRRTRETIHTPPMMQSKFYLWMDPERSASRH